jgi:hypothetical protein
MPIDHLVSVSAQRPDWLVGAAGFKPLHQVQRFSRPITASSLAVTRRKENVERTSRFRKLTPYRQCSDLTIA